MSDKLTKQTTILCPYSNLLYSLILWLIMSVVYHEAYDVKDWCHFLL